MRIHSLREAGYMRQQFGGIIMKMKRSEAVTEKMRRQVLKETTGMSRSIPIAAPGTCILIGS